MFIVTIEVGNAAFQPEPGQEVARLLRELANRIETDGYDGYRLRDYNGNTVLLASTDGSRATP